MTCSTDQCGVGGWGGPRPGDPDNNSILNATWIFGGIEVSWTFPTTNPFAVAHTLVYRSTTNSFLTAILIAGAGGNTYYDKTDPAEPIQYYYWIKFVSINGTEGALIGPASAIANPIISKIIEDLTGKIDAGVLATSLRSDIDKITLNYAELTAEIAARLSANALLSQTIGQIQGGLDTALGAIASEIVYRQEGDSALVGQVNTIAALNNANAAAILTEQTARVTADSAQANSITNLFATTASLSTAISTETTARTNADTALASQITTVQSSAAANLASAQTALQTNINTVNGKVTSIGALYTTKVTVNGLVGGFGVYNDGTTVEAGFDVDTFWVGKTAGNKKKPFIITGGVVYMDQALINELTFTKLKDATGSFVVSGGKIQANYLNVVEIYGNGFTSYAWPANGTKGFYLGPSGLLLGNANGASYMQYDTATGAFNLNGKITATGAGVVVADLVDIRRRAVLQSGSVDVGLSVLGTYIEPQYGATTYYTAGKVWDYEFQDILLTDIYDANTQNASANQPYYVAASVDTSSITALRNYNGGACTVQFMISATVAPLRTFSNSGSYADDNRLAIRALMKVKLVSGFFNSFSLPPIKWTLYKL